MSVRTFREPSFGLFGRVSDWLQEDTVDPFPIPPVLRRLGMVWICVSVPFTTAVSFFVHSTEMYLVVLVVMGAGAYTVPALVAGWYVVRHGPSRDRTAYAGLYLALVITFAMGVGILVGLATGWRWGNTLGVLAVVVACAAGGVGLTRIVRSRSGYRMASADIFEVATAIVAVIAPLIVMWGPAVLDAEEPWFAQPLAAATIGAVACTYMAVLLLVRLGPGRAPLEKSAVALGVAGVVNATLHTAQGVRGFDLPFPPLVAADALCFAMFLLIPLHTPTIIRPGLAGLPPQAQVRSARFATLVPLLGLAALLVATARVADERSWAVPFSLGAVSLLFVLWGLRQMVTIQETKGLYQQVERAAEERSTLLSQLLERSVHERRQFAGQMYAQAAAAYASFRVLAEAPTSTVPQVSARVGGDFAERADSVHELVMAIRPREADRETTQRLAAPIHAYVATLYGDQPAPELTVAVAEDLRLDWVAETAVLQIVQEALHNVWRHSEASTVEVAIDVVDDAITIRIHDDGTGFDVTAVPEGSGLAITRAAAAVIQGTLVVESAPGDGTTITARVGAETPELEPPPRPPDLRVVRP